MNNMETKSPPHRSSSRVLVKAVSTADITDFTSPPIAIKSIRSVTSKELEEEEDSNANVEPKFLAKSYDHRRENTSGLVPLGALKTVSDTELFSLALEIPKKEGSAKKKKTKEDPGIQYKTITTADHNYQSRVKDAFRFFMNKEKAPQQQPDFIRKPVLLSRKSFRDTFTSNNSPKPPPPTPERDSDSDEMYSLFFFNLADLMRSDPTARKLFEEGEDEQVQSTTSDKKPDLVFEPLSNVPKGGPLIRLLQWMATVNKDEKVLEAFLLAYRAPGLTPYDLIIHIHKAYMSVPMQEIPPSIVLPYGKAKSLREWNRKRLVDLCVKVVYNCTYVELYEEVYNGNNLVDYIQSFIADAGSKSNCAALSFIIAFRNKPLPKGFNLREPIMNYCSPDDDDDVQIGASSGNVGSPFASPTSVRLKRLTKIATSSKSLSFTQFSAEQLSLHMHLIDFQIFEKINVTSELIGNAWNKESRRSLAPNVIALIDRFNRVSYWVATEIVTAIGHRNQLAMLKKFITIAQHCRQRHNFNSVMQVLAGLNMSPVVRLKEVWDNLPEKYRDQLKELENLMSNKTNFKNYRTELASVTESHTTDEGPILPYLGIYLRDLTFMEDGNPNYLDTEKILLNFEKIQMYGSTLLEIQKYQHQPNLVMPPTDEDPLIFNYLSNLTVMDDETLYERSQLKARKSLAF